MRKRDHYKFNPMSISIKKLLIAILITCGLQNLAYGLETFKSTIQEIDFYEEGYYSYDKKVEGHRSKYAVFDDKNPTEQENLVSVICKKKYRDNILLFKVVENNCIVISDTVENKKVKSQVCNVAISAGEDLLFDHTPRFFSLGNNKVVIVRNKEKIVRTHLRPNPTHFLSFVIVDMMNCKVTENKNNQPIEVRKLGFAHEMDVTLNDDSFEIIYPFDETFYRVKFDFDGNQIMSPKPWFVKIVYNKFPNTNDLYIRRLQKHQKSTYLIERSLPSKKEFSIVDEKQGTESDVKVLVNLDNNNIIEHGSSIPFSIGHGVIGIIRKHETQDKLHYLKFSHKGRLISNSIGEFPSNCSIESIHNLADGGFLLYCKSNSLDNSLDNSFNHVIKYNVNFKKVGTLDFSSLSHCKNDDELKMSKIIKVKDNEYCYATVCLIKSEKKDKKSYYLNRAFSCFDAGKFEEYL